MGPSSDSERARRDAWQCLADACTEHDCDHERRALARLIALGEIPAPRTPTDTPSLSAVRPDV